MKKIKVGDIVVIAAILLLTAGVFCFRFFCFDEGNSVTVSVGGREETYSLDENRKVDIENNGISLCIVIKDGQVFVERSDCKGKDCVNMGKISREGQMIACAPSEVLVKIGEKGADGYDCIIG